MIRIKKLGLTLLSASILGGCCASLVVACGGGQKPTPEDPKAKEEATKEANKYEFKDTNGSIIRSLINAKKHITDEEVQNAIKDAINNDKNYCGIIGLIKDQTKDDKYTLTVDSVTIKQETYESKDGEDISKYGKVSEITIVVDAVKDGKVIKVGKSFNQKLSFTYFYDYSFFAYVNQEQTDSKARFNNNQFYFFDNKVSSDKFTDSFKKDTKIDLKKVSFTFDKSYWVVEYVNDDGGWANKGMLWFFPDEQSAKTCSDRPNVGNDIVHEFKPEAWKSCVVIRAMKNVSWYLEGMMYIFNSEENAQNFLKTAEGGRFKLGIDFEMWKIS